MWFFYVFLCFDFLSHRFTGRDQNQSPEKELLNLHSLDEHKHNQNYTNSAPFLLVITNSYQKWCKKYMLSLFVLVVAPLYCG